MNNIITTVKNNILTGTTATVIGLFGSLLTLFIDKGVIVPSKLEDVWVALPAFLVGLVTHFKR